MPKIKVDDIEYNTEDMSEEALAQIRSLQFLETQLAQLRQEIAVCQTAQRTYAAALKAEIDRAGLEPVSETAAEGD